jgi:hypothetical protein
MFFGKLHFDLERAVAKFCVQVPQTEMDENYQQNFFRSVFDVEKFFSGAGGTNFIKKSLLNSYRKSNNSEPKFPLKKVRI